MKIQVLSDIHLEGGVSQKLREFKPSSDVLVLAGDIVTPRSIDLLPEIFGEIGVPVLYVPGNHEYYRGSYPEEKEDYQRVCERTSNIRFLDEDSVIIDDVAFIGATLWSNPDPVYESRIHNGISDFHAISGFDIEKMRKLNASAKKFIEEEVLSHQKNGLKTVVITHFAPSYQAQEQRFAGGVLGSYFYNRLDDLADRIGPNLWIYGHTHGNISFNMGRVPVITNQQGYLGEETNKTFDVNFVYEL